MKKTVKILTLILALIMCVSCFAACGDDKNSKDDDNDGDGGNVEAGETNGGNEETEHTHNYINGVCYVCGKAEPKPSKWLEFELDSDGKSYSVVGIGTCTDTEIVIPSTYEGKPVTSIGDFAFRGCSSLTSVTIPDSVTSIGGCSFSCCESLTNINIPDSVTSIDDFAFSHSTSLTSVTIPNSVTSISGCAFSGCTSLASIVVDKNNKVYHSAGNCIIETASKRLIAAGGKASVIPTDGSVMSIGDSAFNYCDSLTSITIPGGVWLISNNAFLMCSSLTNINIPNSVTRIGAGAFYGCTSLTSINFNGTKAEWEAINKGEKWNSRTGDYTVHCMDGDISE